MSLYFAAACEVVVLGSERRKHRLKLYTIYDANEIALQRLSVTQVASDYKGLARSADKLRWG